MYCKAPALVLTYLRVLKHSSLIRHPSLIFFLLTIMASAKAQVSVTGTVFAKDDKSPLPGVNVVEKGTRNGTTTTDDGTFLIELSNPNSTLVFSFIGMVTQEVPLKGRTQIIVLAKWDCNKDFFDSQQIFFYANNGLINNGLGGQLEVASPWIFGGVVKGLYSYQTNLKENELQIAQLELSHYISNCDFDMDFRWNYRQVSFGNDFDSRGNSFETDLNFRNVKLIAGYTHLNFHRIETGGDKGLSGVLIGAGTSFNTPLYPTLTGKVSLYRNRLEYQASIQGSFKDFLCFVKFYKLDSFNELSLGIGTALGYRLKSQRK